MLKRQIAEINIARMKGVNIQDPVMLEFVENLEKVNAIAEGSEGFVWRLKEKIMQQRLIPIRMSRSSSTFQSEKI
jgi:hypothetical protein